MAKIISSLPGSSAGILSRTSQLINDGSDNTSTYVETDELGTTAFSNNYNDLDNLPIIGNGITNLDYTPSPTNGIVTSDTGTDATIPLADNTNAGLISAAEKVKLNNTSGINSGDQTSIVGITGTKSQFNTAVTDGDILFVGDVTQYTDELAQDTVGGILIDTTTIDLTYNDSLNTISADIKPNSITATQLADNINISEFVNTTLVPYTGATTDVDLGEHQLKAGQVEFDLTPTGTFGVGKLRWNDTDGTLEFMMKRGNVIQQVGHELPIPVKHADGLGLINGRAVYVTGSDGEVQTVRYAGAGSEVSSTTTLGIMTENAIGSDEAFCTTFGKVRDLNTSHLIEGAAIWISPANDGTLTSTKPSSPNQVIYMGICLKSHATQGAIFVKVDRGYKAGEVLAVGLQTKYYLDSTLSLADNYTLSNTPSIYPETAKVISATTSTSPVFFERFVSAPLGKATIPAGTWTFSIYGATSNNAGNNVIDFRINKRVLVNGIVGTWTGVGATRTFTASSGTPFAGLTTTGNRLTAPLIETPNQTGWVTVVNSPTTVTVSITDIGYVNESNVSLNAIYYWLFAGQTNDITGATATLYTVTTVQPEFTGFNDTDRLVIAFFATTDQTSSRTISLFYGGTQHFTHFESPLSVLHNDLGGLNVGDYQHITVAEKASFVAKQDTLVSGTNIKTLDGDSLLGSGNLLPKTELAYALADETANLTVSTRLKFRMPFAMTLSEVRISLNDAPTLSSVVVDVKENGVSIFSTLLSIDANEKTSVTAATPAVISDINLADDAEITVSTTQIGSGNTGKGLKILFKGRKV